MSITGEDDRPSQVLRRGGRTARRSLGQNFLQDKSFLPRIVQAAELEAGDDVLEIGPGTGVLTQALAECGAKVVAVELDGALADILRATFASNANVEIVQGDALSLDPCDLFGYPYKLVANIPYYITGLLIRRFLETPCPPDLLVLMVQREVAQRMVAAPGRLSLLGVSVQFYARTEIIARVPAGAFYPRPKVDSAIVRLRPYRDPRQVEIAPALFELARAGFSVRRKQLINSLSAGLGNERVNTGRLLEQANIAPERRAETLSIAEWICLAEIWREHFRSGDA